MSISQKIALLVIKFYKFGISPYLPGGCRYLPTCSEYAKDAIIKHGAMKGMFMALKRIGRCHPWGGSGYDPVA